jgi:hypothetical protein
MFREVAMKVWIALVAAVGVATLASFAAIYRPSPPQKALTTPLKVKPVQVGSLSLADQSIVTDKGTFKSVSVDHYVTKLCGRIKFEHRYGSPNFGETPKIDQVEDVATVELQEPIFFNRGNTPYFDGPYLLKKIQVFPVSELSKFKGKGACFAGTLFERQTGHHFYPVLLDLSDRGSASEPSVTSWDGRKASGASNLAQ